MTYDTLHWDGNQLLFTTNSNGQVDDIKVGAIGDITPLDSGYKGLTFWDRVAGALAFCHNATGAAGEDVLPSSAGSNEFTGPYMKNYGCVKSSGQTISMPTSIVWRSDARLAGGVGQGNVLGMERADGISDGANTIQGVRTFDAVQGQWTTPDAYAGDVEDPMSQKSYMWNGNNAVAYSDPSGYLYGENGGAAMYSQAVSGGGIPLAYDEQPEDGSANPDDPSFKTKQAYDLQYMGLVALQAAADAVAISAGVLGHVQGNLSFTQMLSQLVISGLDSVGIKAFTGVSGDKVTASDGRYGNTVSLEGGPGGVKISQSLGSKNLENKTVVWSSQSYGPQVSMRLPSGRYGDYLPVYIGASIKMRVNDFNIFLPYVSP